MLINSNSAPHLPSNFSETSYNSFFENIAQNKLLGRKIAVRNILSNATAKPRISPFMLVSIV
jgi:hypothetical protein